MPSPFHSTVLLKKCNFLREAFVLKCASPQKEKQIRSLTQAPFFLEACEIAA